MRVVANDCGSLEYTESDFTAAFDWIVANHDPADGTAIVNLSMASALLEWGDLSNPAPQSFRDAVFGLAARDDLLLIQSAGNANEEACAAGFGDESSYAVGSPEHEAFSRVVIVGGSDENDGRWLCDDPPDEGCTQLNVGSNFGACVDIFAPAAHVVSAYRGHGVEGSNDELATCRLSGTSFAAPHVTGIAALILEEDRFLSSTELKARLLDISEKGSLNQASGDRNFIGSGSPNRLVRFFDGALFSDGFESGDTSSWTSSSP